MKITFRAFATFRKVIGEKEFEMTLPVGEKIRGLLEKLCNAHPGLRDHLFDHTGQIKPDILILKNGRSISLLQKLDTVIDEGDVISLFPPVTGG